MQRFIIEKKGGFIEFKGGNIEFQDGKFEFIGGFFEFEGGFFEFQGGLFTPGFGIGPEALFCSGIPFQCFEGSTTGVIWY